MAQIRAACILIGFVTLLLLALPVQALMMLISRRTGKMSAQTIAWALCMLVGIRFKVKGAMVRGKSVLLASNHTSYFDIVVLGALGHVAFISKAEVKKWPVIGWIAQLARTVFVEREKRAKTGQHRDMIQTRLAQGDTLVLFPEGTSSDGNRVLPFKSALMGAAQPARKRSDGSPAPSSIVVQPVSVAFTGVHGLPMGRQYRPFFAWYGDMDLLPHLWETFLTGPMDVEIHFYPPVLANDFNSRQDMAKYCHAVVAAGVAHALAGREGLAPLDEIAPAT
jgi:1-acyl-sn-glycerol-3-phosphate acyltransferase